MENLMGTVGFTAISRMARLKGAGIVNPLWAWQDKNPEPRFDVYRQDIHPAHADSESDNGKCGCASCTPSALQRLARHETFLAQFGLVMLAKASVFAYLSATLSTLQKRFGMSTQSASAIFAMPSATELVALAVLSVSGRRCRTPIWLGVAAIVYSLGVLSFALPQAVFGGHALAFRPDNQKPEFCNANPAGAVAPDANETDTPDVCLQDRRRNKASFVMFMLAAAMLGLGMPTQLLGVKFVQHNTHASKMPAMLTVLRAIRHGAQTLGFFLATMCLSTYTDSTRNTVHTVTSHDVHWIGAWWIGPLLIGTVMLVSSVCLPLYPQTLPTGEAPDAEGTDVPPIGDSTLPRRLETIEFQLLQSLQGLLRTPVDLLTSINGVARNPVFLLTVLGTCAQAHYIAGFLYYLPKYLQSHFQISTVVTPAITAAVGVTPCMIGSSLVACAQRRWVLYPRGAILACAACASALLLGVLVGNYLSCPGTMAGSAPQINLTSHVAGGANSSNCSEHCGCRPLHFTPVCGADGRTYPSACQAGCKDDKGTECACVPSANDGLCPRVDGCATHLAIYLAIIFIVHVLSSPSLSLTMAAQVSCLQAEDDKTVAVALSYVTMICLTWIPGPVITGYFVDKACVLWQYTSCGLGYQGACWIYDQADLRHAFHLPAAAFQVIAVACYSVALCKTPGRLFARHNSEQKQNEDATGQAETHVIPM